MSKFRCVAILTFAIMVTFCVNASAADYMTDSGEVRDTENTDGEYMTDSGEMEEGLSSNEYMDDSGEVREDMDGAAGQPGIGGMDQDTYGIDLTDNEQFGEGDLNRLDED